MDSKICKDLTAHVALRLRRAATQASCRRVTPALTGYASFNFCGNALAPNNLFQIDLPPYTDYQSLEQKLTLAVEYVPLRIFAIRAELTTVLQGDGWIWARIGNATRCFCRVAIFFFWLVVGFICLKYCCFCPAPHRFAKLIGVPYICCFPLYAHTWNTLHSQAPVIEGPFE
jgi:hypothetical protein